MQELSEHDPEKYGVYIPRAITRSKNHLKDFQQMVYEHHDYLQEIKITSILGISKEQMDDGANGQTPLHIILEEIDNIFQIEATPATTEIGKWHIFFRKSKDKNKNNEIEEKFALNSKNL